MQICLSAAYCTETLFNNVGENKVLKGIVHKASDLDSLDSLCDFFLLVHLIKGPQNTLQCLQSLLCKGTPSQIYVGISQSYR